MAMLTLKGDKANFNDMIRAADQIEIQYPMMKPGEQSRTQVGSNQYDVKKNENSWTVEQVTQSQMGAAGDLVV